MAQGEIDLSGIIDQNGNIIGQIPESLSSEEIARILDMIEQVQGGRAAPPRDSRGVPYPAVPDEWRNVVPPAPGGQVKPGQKQPISYSGESTSPQYPGGSSGGTPPPGGGGGGTLPSTRVPGIENAVIPTVANQGVTTAQGGWLGNLGRGMWDRIKNDPFGTMGDVGTVLSRGAQGSAEQRGREGSLALQYGLLANQQARDTYNAGLDSAKFGREGQDRQRKSAILTGLLNGTQDLRLTPGNPKIAAAMGNVAGGARPSVLANNRDSILALLGSPEIQAPAYQPAKLPEMPKAGVGENLAGGAGSVLTILGTLGAFDQPRR